MQHIDRIEQLFMHQCIWCERSCLMMCAHIPIFEDKQLLEISHVMMSFFASRSSSCFFLIYSSAVVDGSKNRPDLHFPPRIKAKISEYASNFNVQITLSFLVIRIENTPDFHLAPRQQRKKFQIFHQFTTDVEFGD